MLKCQCVNDVFPCIDVLCFILIIVLLSVVTIFYDDMRFSRFFPESRLFSPSLDSFDSNLDFLS